MEMAITAEEELALEAAGLINLFNKNKPQFGALAQQAYNYAKIGVTAVGMKVRPDDVITVLVPILKLTPTLTKELEANNLRQKYWFTNFGDLMLDRLWGGLKK